MFRRIWVILMLSGPIFAAENMTQRFDVRAFGAVGDGIADDQPALTRAAKAVAHNHGGVLYFPSGVYRCGRQAGMQNGIEFVGVSDVTILFERGAVLVMDNLNPQNNEGDHGHGILFRGPCTNIFVINAAVKWVKKPGGRSMGDAFRFEGFPSDDRCISNIRLIQCSAEFSPQVGAIFMGCSDIQVENFRAIKTYADGLHFNACRRVHVSGVTGIETGDDTLSFVTYEDDAAVNAYSGGPGSFARADFGEWNNTGSTASDIYAVGGGANGVRLAGAVNVALSNVNVEGKLRAIIADCGRKEGDKHSWSWLASRGITISNVMGIGCTSGFYASNFNQPMTAQDKWWRFDIQLSNLSASDCKDDSVLIADAAGVSLRRVKAENKGIRILHARDCTLDTIDLKNGGFIVEGQADASTMQDAPNMGLSIRHIDIDNGFLEIHNCRGLSCEGVRIVHPVGEGLSTSRIFGSRLDGISVE
ncbi:MAG TPA: glycosyl hydrolase family 28-related protein [Verrucomicrobiae bacterium]|nr:glycosyl hydrolase family 28-related protein [Verrucomicrobiae bacterium]